MSKYEFFEGQGLNTLHLSEAEYVSITQQNVSSIKVVMENGQMAGVAWAIVFYKDGRCIKYNLALIQSVELALKGE